MQLRAGLFYGFFGNVLNMSLRFFLVPFRGLENILNGLMFDVADFFVEVGKIPGGDGARSFFQNLFDAAKVFAEASQGFREGLIGCFANAILLEGQGGVEERASTGHAMDGFFGAG